jgi:hypothetical protein
MKETLKKAPHKLEKEYKELEKEKNRLKIKLIFNLFRK